MSGSRAATRRVRQAEASGQLKVVAGYLRLTVDRQGNKIGYDVQKKAIQRWANAYGYSVTWFKDQDLTAAKSEVIRPQYEEMLSRIAAGEFAGVVVWRMDRLVRLTREFERCFGILQDASAFVQDVEQGINSNTATGRFVMRLLVMLAEMEIDAMRARARAHQRWKAEEGLLSAGGFRPFGFQGVIRDKETGAILNPKEALIAHDPHEAQLVREAAKRILSGASYADVAQDWAARTPPIRGTNGKPVNTDALYQILIRPRIAGLREYEIVDDETDKVTVGFSTAEWAPILDRGTWDALRARRKERGPNNSQAEYLLNRGLIKCGRCRRPLVCTTTAAYKTRERRGNYRCNTTLSARETGSCGKLIVNSRFAEDVTCELLFARLAASPELLDLINGDEGEAEAAARRSAHEEIRFCNDSLHDLGRRMALPDSDPLKLDEMESAGMRAGYRERKAAAQRIVQRLARLSGCPTPSDEERRDIPAWFDALALGEKRSFLRAHIREILVAPRTSASNVYHPSRIDLVFTDAKQVRGNG